MGLAGQRNAAVQMATGVVGRAGQPQDFPQRAQHRSVTHGIVERIGQRLRGAQGGEGIAVLSQCLIGVGQLQQGVELLGRVAGLGGGSAGGLPVAHGLLELTTLHSGSGLLIRQFRRSGQRRRQRP